MYSLVSLCSSFLLRVGNLTKKVDGYYCFIKIPNEYRKLRYYVLVTKQMGDFLIFLRKPKLCVYVVLTFLVGNHPNVLWILKIDLEKFFLFLGGDFFDTLEFPVVRIFYWIVLFVKFIFSKKATKIDEISTISILFFVVFLKVAFFQKVQHGF